MIKVLDDGYVKLVETWGSDQSVIEAARMSTDKGFLGWGPKLCDHSTTGDVLFETCPKCKGSGSVEGDEKLLRYLYTHKHMTPFEMAGAVIEVQAPIFVFREWHRHRTQSYNEMSGRYTVLPDLYYLPSIERLMRSKQGTSNKQGSEGGIDKKLAEDIQEVMRETCNSARASYEHLLESGLAREVARMILPVNQYSRMRASANLRNWLGFLALRMNTDVQEETRDYAYAVHNILSKNFPRTLDLFDEVNND